MENINCKSISNSQPGYYDMNYQTPTSLGASGVRDGNLGSVAYSTMTDGRFARTDNNSSPVSNVPSTMSQQTGSGGAVLNLPYAYFYGGMPGGFQYGTPALYPQQMAAANASSGAQFAKPTYNNSGYGSTGYDTLSQSAQDYSKNAYAGSGGQQSKGQNVSNPPPSGTGSDISSSMYGNKSHAALNKVNVSQSHHFRHNERPPSAHFTNLFYSIFFSHIHFHDRSLWARTHTHTPTVVRETIVSLGNTATIYSGWLSIGWGNFSSIRRSAVVHSSDASHTPQHEHASADSSGQCFTHLLISTFAFFFFLFFVLFLMTGRCHYTLNLINNTDTESLILYV